MLTKVIFILAIFFASVLAYGDAVIFSGNDVKTLKYNIDLFGRSKVIGYNGNPSAGLSAPLGSIAMDYLTGNMYRKSGSADTQWVPLNETINSITSGGGSVTLTATSSTIQYVTGSSGQTITLPDATTLAVGRRFVMINDNSSGNITVRKNGAALLITVPPTKSTDVILTDNSTSAGTWIAQTGFTNLTLAVTGTLPIANGGTNSNTALNNDKVMISSSGSIVESIVTKTELEYLAGLGGAPANRNLSNLTATAVNTGLTFNVGGNTTIKTKDQTIVGSDVLQIKTGDTSGVSTNTGDLEIASGAASGNSSTGSIDFHTGDANGTTSGDIYIYSGNGNGASTNSGLISMITGTISGGSRGYIEMEGSAINIRANTPLRLYDADTTNYIGLVVASNVTSNSTLTLPQATDTLVGKATTDILTNKTISGASNTITNVSLTTGVTGTLPIANGGTNSTATPTAGGIGYGTGTAHAYTSAFTSGNLIASGGSGAPTQVTLTSGTTSGAAYTTGASNITSVGTVAQTYQRIGNIVHSCFAVDVTPAAAAGTSTTFWIDLPVASNLGATNDLMGSAASGDNNQAVQVFGSSSLDRATINFKSQTSSSQGIRGCYNYTVI